MEPILIDQAVGDIALTHPSVIPLLEKHHIDFSSRGAQPLKDAAQEAGADPARLLDEIQAAASEEEPTEWPRHDLDALIDHILSRHHAPCRTAAQAIRSLMDKALATHGKRFPWLYALAQEVTLMLDELEDHMLKEERILFPLARRLLDRKRAYPNRPVHEEALVDGMPVRLTTPLLVIQMEHEQEGERLRRIRMLSSGYRSPDASCATLRGLYAGLEEFERNQHLHMHLENNLLHPQLWKIVNVMD